MMLGTMALVQRTAFAEDPTGLKEIKFNVKDLLKVEGQQQAYFNSTDEKTGGSPYPMVAFILKFLDTAVQISGIIAVILMIVTGLMMVFSQGNQNMVEKAKQMFQYEILGTVIIFVSYVVVTFIQSIFTT